MRSRVPESNTLFNENNKEAKFTESRRAICEEERLERERARRFEIFENLCWMTAGFVSLYHSDFIGKIIYSHPKINWTWMYAALVSASIFASIFVYLNYYLPYKTKQKPNYDHWDQYAPKAIPAATLAGVISIVTSVLAFWPVYQIWTLPYFFSFIMAFLSVLTQMSQPQAQPTIFQQSSHPVAMVFHLLFKTAAVFVYFFLNMIIDNYVLVFVISIILLAFDFWTVKNISGRLLVGLRWWNKIKEDGSNEWVYESKPPDIIENPVDGRVFWWSMYLFTVIWLVFGIIAIFSLALKWLVIVAIALIMNTANLTGYWKCDKEAKKRAMGTISQGFMGQIIGTRLGNIF